MTTQAFVNTQRSLQSAGSQEGFQGTYAKHVAKKLGHHGSTMSAMSGSSLDSHNTANTASTLGKSSQHSSSQQRTGSGQRQRITSMKRKHSSTAEKRKMVCSLPRAPPKQSDQH